MYLVLNITGVKFCNHVGKSDSVFKFGKQRRQKTYLGFVSRESKCVKLAPSSADLSLPGSNQETKTTQ